MYVVVLNADQFSIRYIPVDPGIPKRPIRFKLSVRTEIFCYGFLRTFPRMRPQVIPRLWNVNKRKNHWGHETHISPKVHCGLHALGVTNLNVVTSSLLRTCFKSQSLPNSIIFVTERHFHMFLTLCSRLKFTKMGRRSL